MAKKSKKQSRITQTSQQPLPEPEATPKPPVPAPNQPPLFGAQLEVHQGPIPRAEDFAAYDRILPGAANRILKMAEREQRSAIRLKWGDWLAQFISMIMGKGFL